ncbi:NACHT domain-containing protein [Jatrophihabitans sp. YIM 134969]
MAAGRPRIVVPGRDDVSQQPGNSWKYLYERLSEKRFQQLCGALLAVSFPDVSCFPVGHSDGGRDARRKSASDSMIYQVKWTSKRVQSPSGWLSKAIDDEHDNIERLVADGATKYVLMTNVAGTAQRRSGSIDKLDQALLHYSSEFGIDMDCWWQSDLDARVDAAPTEIKWAYQEMLAGVDAVRYVIESDERAASDQDLKLILRNVIATQWREDAKVKFKQVDMQSYDLSSLFVDVHAERSPDENKVTTHGREIIRPRARLASGQGAADYLLYTSYPFTLVLGEPGQGKSTLGQYICQVHRAAYLGDDDLNGASRPAMEPRVPRMPLRVDLRDYGTWLDGRPPFDESESSSISSRKIRRRLPAVEMFLCELLTARSGGVATNIAAVKDMLDRFPMVIVLDGLDEIAQLPVRAQAVREINDFTARLGRATVPQQVVVTTRPNSSGLPEPSRDIYERVALSKLTTKQRTDYLRSWARARGLSNVDRRALVKTFNKRSIEPHIGQLADNPMQLTILLYLMNRLGVSVPESRTQLYSQYMDAFLAREAEKSQLVAKYREDLEEVTAFLGWHLQSRAELDGDRARMTAKGVKSSINGYLFAVDKPTSNVADLFTAVTDRVWALSSKIEGTFEFDVQSVREYFAAKFLWEYAGADDRSFDPANVLRQLARRPYWLNTTRFYAGFARTNEIADLVETIEEELSGSPRPAQARVTAWTLLTDGVFRGRARSEARAGTLFSDDLGVILVGVALHQNSVTNTRPNPTAANALVTAILANVAADPTHKLNQARLTFTRAVTDDHAVFDEWWQPRLTGAADTEEEGIWLSLGVPHRAAGRLAEPIRRSLALTTPRACRSALEADLPVTPNTAQEASLLRAVLDGDCSDALTTASGFPNDVLRVCAPARFLVSGGERSGVYRADVGHPDRPDSQGQIFTVLRRLRSRDARYENVQKAMTFGRGQRGTTSRWGDTAREIAAIHGPCLLAAEIAVIGAATPDTIYRTGGTLTGARTPLGPDANYGRLLQDIRAERSNSSWWGQTHDQYDDQLSRATWALALTAVARAEVIGDHVDRLADTIDDLDPARQAALLNASSRIGVSSVGRPLPAELGVRVYGRSAPAGLMVLHHVANPTDHAQLGTEPMTPIENIGAAGWPIQHGLSARMLAEPNSANLAALSAVEYTSNVPLPHVHNLADEHIDMILGSPGNYPIVWVQAAEHAKARAAREPTLEEVSAQSQWFGE